VVNMLVKGFSFLGYCYPVGGHYTSFQVQKETIRLNFSMTINKTQGKAFPNVGIYLPEPMFFHGQLYVALSRAISRETI